MATKTVTMDGAEQRVDGLGGLNALIVNNTTEPLYASAKAGIVPYADGVMEIKAGTTRGLPDTNGTVYLLGNGGRAELTGTSAGVNFNVPSSSSEGGGGVTREEVSEIVTDKIAEVVANAPEDLDTLKEISDWIDGHEDSAAAMNSEINANAADISQLQTEQETQNSNISTLQTEMESKANMDEVINLNLFDNPDFRINQRGQDEYGSEKNTIYGMDRWEVGMGTKVIIYSDHINVATYSKDNYNFISQKFENDMTGKTVTISVKAKGQGALSLGQLNVVSTAAKFDLSDSYEIYHHTFTFANYTNSTWRNTAAISFDAEQNTDIEWAKLEYGNHATPYVPPHPATELLKCQRYFIAFSGYPNTSPGEIIGVGYFRNSTTFRVMVPIPTVMRAIPNPVSDNLCVTVNGTEGIPLSGGAVRWYPTVNSVTMDFTSSTEVNAGTIGLLRLVGYNGSKLELSADM